MRGVLSRGIGSSAEFAKVAEALDNTTLFLVSRNGPSHFSIKDESGSTFKTLLGNPHSCSCSEVKTSGTCVHIAFCVLKVLRVPHSHPLASKSAYSDYELSLVISGGWQPIQREVTSRPHPLKRRPQVMSEANAHRQSVTGDEDICSICQDGMTSSQLLTWCRRGCGANIHARCMATYAQFKISGGDKVSCPLCREPWDVSALREDCREKPTRRSKCAAVYCQCCRSRQKGLFYRCVECSNESTGHRRDPFDLCSHCFVRLGKEHREHHFVSSDASADTGRVQWRAVPNPLRRNSILSSDSIQALQSRDLVDDDYDTLLSLDESADLALHLSNVFPRASINDTDCIACSGSAGVLQLPCRHLLCLLCLRRLVNQYLGADVSSLCRLSCPCVDCGWLLFTGLTRERDKPEKATTNSRSEAKVQLDSTVTPPALAFGVAGVCLMPHSAVASSKELPPIAVIRSYRQRVGPSLFKVHDRVRDTLEQLPSLNSKYSLVATSHHNSEPEQIRPPVIRRKGSRIFKGMALRRTGTELKPLFVNNREKFCVNPSFSFQSGDSAIRKTQPSPSWVIGTDRSRNLLNRSSGIDDET